VSDPHGTFRSWRRSAGLLMMVASGFAGLGYQIVWTQQCTLWLGHESAAVLAVVAAFFGGLATGAWTLGARIERSRRPVHWYAGCELVIALWGLLLVFALTPIGAGLLRLTGVQPAPVWQWSVAFLGSFVLLLPATAAMGATLPAMERLTVHRRAQGRSIAALYASNTLGAVIGVLAAAVWLVPGLGLRGTAVVCIGLNLLCALIALAVFPGRAGSVPEVPSGPGPAAAVVSRLALTGLLGIGYEVMVVRVLGQVTENTVYTFALLLAVYLVGSSLGAATYQRWLSRRWLDSLTDTLLSTLAGACLVGAASLWAAGALRAAAVRAFGAGMIAAVAVEALLALVAFGPPTLVMGALFSHLCQQAIRSGVGFGRALGVNTLGAAGAPLVFGVLAYPLLGAKFALLLIGPGYLALTTRSGWSRPRTWLPAACALGLALFAPPLAFIDVPAGGRVVSYQEGVMASVSVVEDADGVARLHINNRQQEGSSATLRVDGRQAWLPLLLHPAPRQALFLGLGTGVTAAAAAEDPALEVDAVELLPEVIAASAHFTARLREGAANPRLHLLTADARRYVRASDRRYDLIVSDNFHPARSGSGSLYTVEHFRAVRQRLLAGGLFCQWLPLHQLDLDSLRSIVRSYLAAYPRAWAMLASNSLETPVLGLVARADGGRFASAVLRDRLARLTVPARLSALGLEDEFAAVGGIVAGPAALQAFAAGAEANTDDHPVVAHRAPRVTYAPDSSPRDRLIALLRQLKMQPSDVLDESPDQEWRARLQAYWTARDRFIELGRDMRPSSDVREMLAQVQEPLLSVLRISPDFRPAYDPLLAMATALARNDVAGARALLTALSELQPARSEARRALEIVNAETGERSRN
jgi:spermidine synthase